MPCQFVGMARPKLPFELSQEQSAELRRLAQAPKTPQKLVRRARIALLAAQGKSNKEIAVELGTSHVTVGQWRQRVLDQGLAGLQEAPRPGRPKTLAADRVQKVLSEVVRPPKGQARWSCRTMAKHSGVSPASVQRLWSANDLKPHRTRTFKLSNDPEFEPKFWDIVGLYLNPPTQAVILCCDEKSQCQALERTQPGLPLGQGHITTRTHDYYRHGTVTLFAALNYLNGKVLAERAPRHRHQEWLKFLKSIDSETPAGLDIHLILDNYATHKHPKVMRWMAARPRFHLHFTPTSASWLNLVERFFRDLSQDVVLPGSFASVTELVDAIWAYLAERNLKPRRYQWRAEGTVILEKIRRAREALARNQPIPKDKSETLH
jgi:transposase